jgi:stage V sporulation protein SpoVS
VGTSSEISSLSVFGWNRSNNASQEIAPLAVLQAIKPAAISKEYWMRDGIPT